MQRPMLVEIPECTAELFDTSNSNQVIMDRSLIEREPEENFSLPHLLTFQFNLSKREPVSVAYMASRLGLSRQRLSKMFYDKGIYLDKKYKSGEGVTFFPFEKDLSFICGGTKEIKREEGKIYKSYGACVFPSRNYVKAIQMETPEKRTELSGNLLAIKEAFDLRAKTVVVSTSVKRALSDILESGVFGVSDSFKENPLELLSVLNSFLYLQFGDKAIRDLMERDDSSREYKLWEDDIYARTSSLSDKVLDLPI